VSWKKSKQKREEQQCSGSLTASLIFLVSVIGAIVFNILDSILKKVVRDIDLDSDPPK
jgi:hypothetical protein